MLPSSKPGIRVRALRRTSPMGIWFPQTSLWAPRPSSIGTSSQESMWQLRRTQGQLSSWETRSPTGTAPRPTGTTVGRTCWQNAFRRGPPRATRPFSIKALAGTICLRMAWPNALARLDCDVIAQPGVRYLIVLEGINDIGMLAREGDVPSAEHDVLVRRILAAYEQIVARAHTYDIKVIGGTILPFAGSTYYHPAPANEADRRAVNDWIRAAGHFDAVIDFDKIMRDPEHPERLLPAYDSGDHLHPSPAGYAAMAEAVPLSLFEASTEPATKKKAN